MATINPYLNFPGTTEAAFNFYKSVFGGEFLSLQRYGDTPVCDGMVVEEKNKIMHIALPIGKGNLLMATDALESMGQSLTAGNNFYINVGTDSEAEADKLFHALSAEGQVEMPISKAFWGDYFGMLTDKFGIKWMVNYEYPQQQTTDHEVTSIIYQQH
ncbi:Glyoxalase/bleomycin resistance protein/dioxygenase [Flammeovirgaceae bacterium 311]|nr:Glyoxalase/bleomycin resistance protein/dioxygenase [Flammeovirgaceae bacterium 311]